MSAGSNSELAPDAPSTESAIRLIDRRTGREYATAAGQSVVLSSPGAAGSSSST